MTRGWATKIPDFRLFAVWLRLMEIREFTHPKTAENKVQGSASILGTTEILAEGSRSRIDNVRHGWMKCMDHAGNCE